MILQLKTTRAVYMKASERHREHPSAVLAMTQNATEVAVRSIDGRIMTIGKTTADGDNLVQ